jgi:RNA polymerase sigma-70 factor (ECF subfamily)
MAPKSIPTVPNQQTAESEVVQLHEQHSASLFRYASSLADCPETARDAVQEAFLRFFVERSYGREIANPRAWLYQVLRNYISDRTNAASSQREVGGENVDAMVDGGQNPETLAQRSQIAREIAASLSARELECLQLRTEGLSYSEIGIALDLRTGTVGALLSRVHEKIRRRAGDDSSQAQALAEALNHLVRGGEICTQS